jgi:hypothetical protein
MLAWCALPPFHKWCDFNNWMVDSTLKSIFHAPVLDAQQLPLLSDHHGQTLKLCLHCIVVPIKTERDRWVAEKEMSKRAGGWVKSDLQQTTCTRAFMLHSAALPTASVVAFAAAAAGRVDCCTGRRRWTISLPQGPAAGARMRVSRRWIRSARALDTWDEVNEVVHTKGLQMKRFKDAEQESKMESEQDKVGYGTESSPQGWKGKKGNNKNKDIGSVTCPSLSRQDCIKSHDRKDDRIEQMTILRQNERYNMSAQGAG